MTKHFVFDILHFDGKFFHTLLYVFTKPGFVPKQYVQGKRMSYLDPIRMYLFTSAVFFLIFFSIISPRVGKIPREAKLTNKERIELVNDWQRDLDKNPHDTALQRKIALVRDTSKPVKIEWLQKAEGPITVSFGGKKYSSLRQYDSIQSALPEKEKDGWIAGRIVRQSLRVKQKYGESEEGAKGWIEAYLHRMPYVLFVSLPFFALILKLLYTRRKNFFYSDHAVFTLYHYIFSFILLLLIFGCKGLNKWTDWKIFDILLIPLFLSWPIYLYLEMKNFYQQGWAKTLGKFLILIFLGLVITVLLFILFAIFAIFQV